MAVGFNASGDYAKRTGAPAFNMSGNTDKFTICGWAKMRDITPGAPSYFLGVENGDINASGYSLVGISGLDIREFSCNAQSHTWSPAPSQDVWYYFYISGHNDGSNYLVFNTGYYTAAGGSPVDSYTTSLSSNEYNVVRVDIGNDSWDEWIDCCMAYVRVWTGYELTDEELRAERDSTSAVKTDGLWADWPLADNTDTDDDSVNNRDLTFGGTLTTEDGPLGGGGATVVTSIVNVTHILTETVCVVDDC